MLFDQVQTLSFDTIQFQQGQLLLNTTQKMQSNLQDMGKVEFKNTELFRYMEKIGVKSLGFKSEEVDLETFSCKIDDKSIQLVIRTSLKKLIYKFNAENSQLYLNGRELDMTSYGGFFKKLEYLNDLVVNGRAKVMFQK